MISASAWITLIIPFFWIKGISPNQSKDVYQTPADLLGEINNNVKLTCKHSINNYDTILWYYQAQGDSSVKLVGFTSYTSVQIVEKPFQGSVNVSGDGEKEAFLHLLKLRHPEDSGHYFCAAYSQAGYDPAFFGSGTKLTVLEPNRTATPPIVQVLQPSDNECRNRRHNTNKKTLVCVASHFYPDHVSVSWQIEEESVTDGVATDHTALWEGYHYRITSRLRVPLRQWFTPGKRFTCTVSFFNGTGTVYNSNYIEGIEGPGAEAVRAKYLRITHSAKLTYIVLIAKSSIYGAFVVLLVWRLQASSGKQNN